LLKKKIRAKFQRIMGLFTKKLSLSSQKYEFGIRDPGSRGQKGPNPGSWIRIRNTVVFSSFFAVLSTLAIFPSMSFILSSCFSWQHSMSSSHPSVSLILPVIPVAYEEHSWQFQIMYPGSLKFTFVDIVTHFSSVAEPEEP
jgi:hypothetical protein